MTELPLQSWSHTQLKVGDKITIEVTGVVQEVRGLSFLLNLSNQGPTSFPYRDAQLVKKHHDFKVGQKIKNLEEMIALPKMSVIKQSAGYVFQKVGDDTWRGGLLPGPFTSHDFLSTFSSLEFLEENQPTIIDLPSDN